MDANRVICKQHEQAYIDGEHDLDTCFYNVYEIWEGAIFAEYSYCDYADAVERFNKLVTQAKQCMETQPELYYGTSGSTVHLYDTVANELRMEQYVQPPGRN